MKSIRIAALGAVLFAIAPALALAATLEETEAKILEAFAKVKTMTADIVMDVPADSEAQGPQVSAGGNLAYLADGEITKFTQELAMKMELPDGLREMTLKMVCDGESLYVLTHSGDEQRAVKSRIEDILDFPPPGGKLLLQALKRDFAKLDALENREADGKACYVIQGSLDESGAAANKLLVYFDKETGAPVQMVMQPEEGAKPATLRYENIRINPEIDPARFVFVAPDGVEVIDTTQAPPPPTIEMNVEPAPVEETPDAPDAP
ncbi:MAG TPA: hypothetical protein PKI11_10050 [Candidatus Hydrogenedentes bacterium]|nr:hypothetical protein [Candidatus Hydrogenedentota bacterium]